jgi:polysaccharide biosynthesis protein PslG
VAKLAAAGLAVLLAVGVWASAAAARSVPHGFYGVTWDREVIDAPPAARERQWSLMARSGVESARTVFSWHLAQPDPDRPPDFTWTDPPVALAAAHGVRLLPIVSYAPEWARAAPSAELASAPRGTDGYAAYLRALVERYGPHGTFWDEHPELPRRPVREYQIWNEPHLRYQWSPQAGWEEAYGELLRVASETLAAADPGARVVLGGITNESWLFLESLYERGAIAGNFDAAAFHVYTRVPRNLVTILRRNRRVLDRHGDADVPIYVTEFGASASAGRIEAPEHRHFQTSDRGLARRLETYYGLLARHRRGLGLRRAYWYTWASSYASGTGVFDFAGLVRWSGGLTTPKPALGAFRRMARRHEGCAKGADGRCRR